jgi:excisionase family DNA binding protein
MPGKKVVQPIPIDSTLGQILSTQQCARILHVSPRTILRLIQQRRLPAARVGKDYRIREDDVKRLFPEEGTLAYRSALPAQGDRV